MPPMEGGGEDGSGGQSSVMVLFVNESSVVGDKHKLNMQTMVKYPKSLLPVLLLTIKDTTTASNGTIM